MTADLFGSDNRSKRMSKRSRQMRTLLLHYQALGWELERVGHPKIANLTFKTLKKWAKRHGIAFPDYTPNDLKGE